MPGLVRRRPDNVAVETAALVSRHMEVLPAEDTASGAGRPAGQGRPVRDRGPFLTHSRRRYSATTMDTATSKQAAAYAFSHFQQIKDVAVTYLDGTTISGFLSDAQLTDWSPRIVLCKHSVGRNESPHVYLDFDEIRTLTITLHNGTKASF